MRFVVGIIPAQSTAVTRTCGDFWATAIPQIPEPAARSITRTCSLAFATFR